MRRFALVLSALLVAAAASPSFAATAPGAACALQLRDAQSAFDNRDTGQKQGAKAAAAITLSAQLCEQDAFPQADDAMRAARLLLATE